MKKLLCFAHRGASGHEPENTVTAVEKAISLGAHWIEIDVYAVDGELIVFHDRRLERTTNGSGYVTEKSLEYIRSLDAGQGQQVPTLREVCRTVGHRAGVNIELKGPDTASLTVDLVQSLIQHEDWTYDHFIISSFNHYELSAVKEIDPRLKTGALVVGIPIGYARFAQELGAYSVHCDVDFITESFVQDAHRRGLNVFVFTVNHAEDLARVMAMDVDGVFTNYPDMVTNLTGIQQLERE